jgi:hypothetical protein
VAQVAAPIGSTARGRFEQARNLSGAARGKFQTGVPVQSGARSLFERVIRLAARSRSGFETGAHVAVIAHSGMSNGVPLLPVWSLRFQTGRQPSPGASPRPPIDNRDDWCYAPEMPVTLLFQQDDRGALALLFECDRHGPTPEPEGPQAPLYILPARYYMTVHSLTARRLPDMQPIRIFGVTMRAGKGSYGWTFNVSATRAAFDQLAPSGGSRAQLLIELDGLQFSGIVTNRTFDEAFGGRGCSITVHSRTALLANPMARETQRVGLFDRTAQQLALEALDLTGFALDWGLTDWLVQAGAWSHSGTPLGAVQTIVEAAGGYLQSHRTAATLLARHPYRDLPMVSGGLMPGAPWNWGHVDVIPDVELSPSVLTRIAVEEDEGPAINGVYLQGTSWGDWALYKRAGTAADLLASPVTDALLTAEEAHRQRGRSIVGQAGVKQLHTYELPVITGGASAPGILEDNQLIQINEAPPWRGMVRDVSVSAPVNREVRQTIVIERHLASA